MRRNPDAQAQASSLIRDEAETSDLRATVQELRTKPKATNLKAKTSLLKPKTAELKKIQPETPGPKPRPQS